MPNFFNVKKFSFSVFIFLLSFGIATSESFAFTFEQPIKAYRFNFTQEKITNFINITLNSENNAPLYEDEIGYGFVRQTCAIPPREVHPEKIYSDAEGFKTVELKFFQEENNETSNYNNYGMAFRIKAAPGAYKIVVELNSDFDDTIVSVSGMQGTKIKNEGFWDAAKLVPIDNVAILDGNQWKYNFVNGRDVIDIEIEPNKTNVPVGIKTIVLTSIRKTVKNSKPTIFTLGDSTVKTYTYNEIPMSGWGQVFDDMFNTDKVNVINYSMGGRSFKSAYYEGRLNDILLKGKPGDIVLLQSGHNDESTDENSRFGRGNTEETYSEYIREVYLPSVKSVGMIPVFVTPMSRINANAEPGYVYSDSFTNRKFPAIMRALSNELNYALIDLNSRSVEYYNELGVEGTTAVYMSIEAGETPGMNKNKSYANGHVQNKIDGTHFKEALSKQFSRIITEEIYHLYKNRDYAGYKMYIHLKKDVKKALQYRDWSTVFPEVCHDTITGPGSYYRNQIEKLVQLGSMKKDENGNFNPDKIITVNEYIDAVSILLNIDKSIFNNYEDKDLTREVMACILYDAYYAAFTEAPGYLTDFNGTSITPFDPDYNPYQSPETRGIMYYPIVSYQQLEDTYLVDSSLTATVENAYKLGLIRSENGIMRGKIVNGTLFEPQRTVTRSKASKSLYFIWALSMPLTNENNVSH